MYKKFLTTIFFLCSTGHLLASPEEISPVVTLQPIDEVSQQRFVENISSCRAIIYAKDSENTVLGLALKGRKYLFNVEDQTLDNLGRYDRKNNAVYISNITLGATDFYDIQISPTSKTVSCLEKEAKGSCKLTQAKLLVSKNSTVALAAEKSEIEVTIKDYCGMHYTDRIFLPQNLIFNNLSKLTAH